MYHKSKNKIMVIGHKNPDTDSICSAIAFANLMNRANNQAAEKHGSRTETGYSQAEGLQAALPLQTPASLAGQSGQTDYYEPCRAGVISAETAFVLRRFHFQIPHLRLDVRAQVSDLGIRREPGILPDTSLRDAWELMKEKELPTLPVVDKSGALLGVIAVRDIAMANMDILDSNAFAGTNVPVRNILRSINGVLINGNEDSLISKGRITIGASNVESIKEKFLEDDILIVGDQRENQLCAVELGASVVILCVTESVDDEIVELAKARGCVLIRTKNDTYTTARLLTQSIPVSNYMKSDVLVFEPSTQIDEVKDTMSRERYDYFPVVDHGRVTGLISKRNLLSLKKKQLILVDHNEKSQCVDGYEEAEILGIIDHHRIGDIETTGPILFRNVPVGCSSTIINDMYHEMGVEITPDIAGIMCCAILSDTLAFRSPTCTPRDRAAAEELAAIAGVDCLQLASEMFDAGEDLTGKTAETIYHNDLKILRSNELRIAIAQGTFNSPSNLKKAEEIISGYIGDVLDGEKVDLAFYVATSIPDQSSDVIYAGSQAEMILNRAFKTTPGSFGLGLRIQGLVSRKKQFVPGIINAMQDQD